MTRIAIRSAVNHQAERPVRIRLLLNSRMVAVFASVLALFLLLSASAWATAPTLETSFSGPENGSAESIAVNEATGEIFVIDPAKEAVDRYRADGVLLEEIGAPSEEEPFFFGNQYDQVAVDNSGGVGQGRLYINSVNAERVFAYKLESGVYKKSWSINPGFSFGLSIDRSGNPWRSTRSSQSVVELNPEEGATVREVATPGVEDERIAFDSENHLLATFRNGSDVVEFDSTTGQALGSGNINEPRGIAIDSTTNDRFVAALGSVTIFRPDWSKVSGTPFFADSETLAVNGAAGKLYTAPLNGQNLGNEIKIWHIAQRVPVTVAKTGGGTGVVSSVPAGIECGSVCSAGFEEGETVVLKATPDAGSAVVGWAGCAFEPSPDACEVTVGQVNSVSVDFAKALSLTVNKTGSGTVTSTPAGINCGTTCSASYLEGTKVVLTASPATHNKVGWEGCAAEPAANKCEVIVSSAMSVSVAFSPIMHSLTVTKAGDGTGAVTCDGGACAASYPEGSMITLAGTAASGSTFAGFSGAGCSGVSCSLTLEGDMAVTATFNLIPSSGGGTGTTPTETPAPSSKTVPKGVPVVKTVKCKRGFVKRKVHGKMRCVKLKKHAKHKKKTRKHH